MSIMKILKYWMFGLLLGEIIVLLQKDEQLKKKYKNKKSYQKVELITKELVSVNKQVLTNITKGNPQKIVQNILAFFKIREEELQKIIKGVHKWSKDVDQEYIHQFIQSFKIQK